MASQSPALAQRVVAYLVAGQDNGSHFFEVQPPQGVLCQSCGTVLDTAYRPTRLRLRTRLDFSSTYDNAIVVSGRFRSLCEEHMIPGLAFHPVKGLDAEYYFVEALREVQFDAERRKTRFIGKCDKCGNFEEIIGVTPAYLRLANPIERGFFRTDLVFGSRNAKRPALIVDLESAIALRKSKVRGMDLHKAEGPTDAI